MPARQQLRSKGRFSAMINRHSFHKKFCFNTASIAGAMMATVWDFLLGETDEMRITGFINEARAKLIGAAGSPSLAFYILGARLRL